MPAAATPAATPPATRAVSEGLLPSPTVLWQAPFAAVAEGSAGQELAGAWKLLLLGDGSPTRHLRLLVGAPLEVELIAMAAEAAADERAPREVAELEEPLLRRQVWLNCGGHTLGWAESWWNRSEAETHLRDARLPIWRSLTAGRTELFREVDGLARVQARWLEERFGCPGPFWSRHYRFFRGGRELTVIREVFSPALERWLGPATAPRHPHDLA